MSSQQIIWCVFTEKQSWWGLSFPLMEPVMFLLPFFSFQSSPVIYTVKLFIFISCCSCYIISIIVAVAILFLFLLIFDYRTFSTWQETTWYNSSRFGGEAKQQERFGLYSSFHAHTWQALTHHSHNAQVIPNISDSSEQCDINNFFPVHCNMIMSWESWCVSKMKTLIQLWFC